MKTCGPASTWQLSFSLRSPGPNELRLSKLKLSHGAHMAWLTVRRTSDDDIKERELYVSLDGDRLGILKYGDGATVPIAAGRHILRVHNTLSRKKAEFDVAPGQHVRFRMANVPGKGFAYWAFFVGAALFWTILEREEDGPEAPVARPFKY